MKKILVIMTTVVLTLGIPISAYANSLDDVISGAGQNTQQVEQPVQQQPVVQQPVAQPTEQDTLLPRDPETEQFINSIKDANKLSGPTSGATKVNQGIKKVASFIIQIVSYFLTACLALRVVLDLCYVCIPFSRSFLSNGYGGNPQAGGGMGMQQPGMGGMGMGSMGGMGGMGMGGMGMGMRGGYGMNRMGMGGMGGQGSMPGATPAMGRIQWVSNAALNAAAAESVVGPDNRAVNPLKVYVKDMVPLLVVTPILLTLAITGVLTDLGFLLGDLLARAVESIGNMI